MRVKVYFNIQKKMFSIMANEGPSKGLVIGHQNVVHLRDVDFRVSEASRQRVIRDKQKNVHAFAVGTLIPKEEVCWVCEDHVSYNPYKCGNFFLVETDKPVFSANMAKLYVQDNKGFILI